MNNNQKLHHAYLSEHIKRLLDQLHSRHFFGKLTLQIESGNVTVAKLEQSFVPRQNADLKI
jgi:hypothetical protein